MSSTTTFLETSGGRHILNINVQRHKAAKLKREKEKAEFSGLYPPNTTFAASSASLDSDAEAEAAARHFLPAPKSISEMTEEELKEQLALPPGRLTPFTINRIKDRLDVLRGEDKRRREAAIAWEKERRAQIIAREKERQLPDERDTLENLDKQAKEEARERRRLAAAKRAEEARIDAEMKAEFQRANMSRTRKLSDNIPTIVSTGLSKLGIIGKGPTNMPEMPPMLAGTIRRARLDMQMEASAARREAFLASRPQYARAESAPVPTAKSGGSLLSRFPRPTRSEVSLPLGGSPRKNKMSSSSARPVVPTSPSTTSLTSPLFFKSYRRRAASSTTALASTTVTKETGPRPKIASSPSTMSLSTPTFFRTYRRRAASSSSALVSTTTTATTTNQTTGSQPSSTDTSSQTLPRTTRGLRRARPSIKIVRFNPQSEHTSGVGGTAPLKIVKSNKTKGEEGCEEMPPPLPPKDPWYQPGDKVRRKEGSKSKQGKELESDAWVLVDTAQSESE